MFRAKRIFCATATAASLLAAFGAATPAAADALSTPALSPTLSGNANPADFEAGPLGKIYITGAFTGVGLVQSDHSPFDRSTEADVSNAQVFIQNTSGPLQFFLQVGAYSLPDLGAPYVRAGTTTPNTFTVLPVAYVKLQPTSTISIQVGKLPTLIGAESTFTFQNFNIERGLLWNQEPAISRGVQVNYSKGPIALSVSLNDGFYSGRYNWVSGLFTYTFSPKDSLTFDGGASLSHYDRATAATPPLQNNGGIFNIMYTHTEGPWVITPYFQYTRSAPIMVDGEDFVGANTYAGAVLAKYSFNANWSLAGRAEFIATSNASCLIDSETCVQSNVLYGPGSKALSLTLTPTFQKGVFFIRGEGSYVNAFHIADGGAFGLEGESKSQFRGMIETGFLF